jgi:hypothetical protein
MNTKICGNCAWVRAISEGKRTSDYVCMNPKNDELWDYFNHTSGEVVRYVRQVQQVLHDNHCEHFTPIKGIK